jgi:hypothetical protein
MGPTTAFLVAVALVVFASMAIVAYVSRHLRTLLIELCGTVERASFWLAFSNVALVLVPLIFAISYKPEQGPGTSVVFEMAAQLKYGFIGFVITLSLLAIILFRFIPSTKPSSGANVTR